jgi:hypothetical protein
VIWTDVGCHGSLVFTGEAAEVLTQSVAQYALPVHRMREMGFHDRTFDMMDERRS